MADDFPNGWRSAAVTPDAPGWYERRYSDGTYVHHWNGSQWSATKDGNAHWRQLADAPYPLWRPIPALGAQALQANPVADQNAANLNDNADGVDAGRQPLTLDRIEELWEALEHKAPVYLARAVERAHGIGAKSPGGVA